MTRKLRVMRALSALVAREHGFGGVPVPPSVRLDRVQLPLLSTGCLLCLFVVRCLFPFCLCFGALGWRSGVVVWVRCAGKAMSSLSLGCAWFVADD